MRGLENFLANNLTADLGKLMLRFTLGFLMLFHGYKKYLYGIDGIKALVAKNAFPEILAYGVFVGEILAPILIIIGLYTRISSFILTFTMGFAIYLVHSAHILSLNEKTGGLLIETPLLFMMGALSLIFIGAGRFALDKEQKSFRRD